MMAFHEQRFPLRLSLTASGGPVRQTDIVNLSNGREARNRRWCDSRRRYDAGSGLRSVEDLYAVLAFFEARSGQLHGFRFRDPLDFASAPPGQATSALDQRIGIGDGVTRVFPLTKTYGDAAASHARRIEKPVEGTVRVSVDGSVVDEAVAQCDPVAGLVTFAEGAAPPMGAVIRAGFEFDVPVRFDTDRIEVNLEAFRAGRIPAIPLIEVKP
ncbi:DUF2460 domain-containing protein [Peteryoungia desertarenae]|uniref:DUF2460 domain-containing protein n=1 Tax=Peteryoungia desertarenae TaxID=1813451 RepID=A0ABX6QRS6_9HYPH|nr:DUF2460 domain-containing protein [Peteryoungia desertarenae]QLF71366.1 DUF2460 domain-containing protein [Peteryoungia desertarenae]